MLKLIKNNLILIAIILIAIILRLSWGNTPPSLNWDEVSHGYNAYSILTTGVDEWGEKYPTIFRAYGDYKLPVYIYLTAISESIFGLNIFAVRLPSILAGIGTVIFTYLLALELFKNHRSLATIASLFVAIEPWTLFLSRAAFEANLALFFFVSGTYFFLRGFHRLQFTVLSSLFFGLTMWTYNSYRIFTPLFLSFLLIIYRKSLIEIYRSNKHLIHKSLIIILVFLVPMFYQLATTVGQARYSKVSILDEGAINKINELRFKIYELGYTDPIPRLMANKATYFVQEFGKNYISYFDPRFLFIKGGDQYQFSIPNTGLLYIINLPFFYLGIYYLFKLKNRESKLLLVWLLLAPVAGSLTRESPHVLRGVTMLPIPMILSAFGFIRFTAHRSLFTFSYVILLFVSMYFYLINYLTNYRINYSWSWQYGYKEAVDYIKSNYNKYDKFLITKKYGEPHEFTLFYLGYDSQKFRNDPNLIRFYQSGWYWVDRFDKFYFLNDWQVRELRLESGDRVDCSNTKCLLVTSPNNYPDGFKKLETINFLDTQPAFEIYDK